MVSNQNLEVFTVKTEGEKLNRENEQLTVDVVHSVKNISSDLCAAG